MWLIQLMSYMLSYILHQPTLHAKLHPGPQG